MGCGGYGHWKGDPECPEVISGERPQWQPKQKDKTTGYGKKLGINFIGMMTITPKSASRSGEPGGNGDVSDMFSTPDSPPPTMRCPACMEGRRPESKLAPHADRWRVRAR